MNTLFKLSIAAIIGLSFAACGGGGGDSSTSVDTSTQPSSYTISGTVPGTIIEAYCNDGSYYSVESNDNGTTEHPFELTIPSNLDCRFVMITNEDAAYSEWIITPITFSVDGSTGTYLTIGQDLDLGNVPLATEGSGVQEPLEVSINGTSVEIKSLGNDLLDSDNDGVPNVYEDDDSDGAPNKVDEDDDGDDIPDTAETTDDHDGDGISDIYDNDDDNDGEADSVDTDYDNDGISNDEDESEGSSGGSTSTPTTLPSTFTASQGRLLGSQCAQCHGTNGVSSTSWDSIRNEDDIITQESFNDADELIMQHQADGYTYAEALAIRNWLNSL